MAIKIRLARGGTKKRPFYRVVVADARSPRDGKIIERIGSYNPLLPKDSAERVQIDAERAQYWLSQGAQATEKLEKLLYAKGITKTISDFASKPKKAVKNPGKLAA
jgi:small subunit ribosomal protein S16